MTAALEKVKALSRKFYLTLKTFYLAPYKNPEQIARDRIDFALEQSGWVIQDKKKLNLGANTGIAVREY